MREARQTAPPEWPLVLTCAALLSVVTVAHQIVFMGLDWHESVQWERTQKVIQGASGNPWQYRVLMEGLVYTTVRAFELAGVPRPVGTAFVLVRLLQNFAVFALAVSFYRRLGLTAREGILGIALLGWGMGHALYDADLAFNTYADMAFFLAAGVIILSGRVGWLVPLMVLAALNRETSGCIPFLLLFARLRLAPRPRVDRHVLIVFVVCLLVWAGITGGLRLAYGDRPLIVPTPGVGPVWPLLYYNLTWWRTWVFLFATLGILPLVALAGWRGWPPPLRRFFWAVVPVWFPAHFALAHAPETRLFLVPQVLIFVPGALWAMRWFGAARDRGPGSA